MLDHNKEMCNLSEALVELGIEQGVKRGIEQGIEQGVKQGIEQGKELGREERNISMAQMMIREREPVEKIERYTGYTLEKLKEIANGIGMSLMIE